MVRGLLGFTALHLEALHAGVASLHAANLAGLGRGDAAARELWLDALERPLARRSFEHLTVLCPGRAQGILVGGNLTLLFTAAASGQLTLPPRSILFFEEVNEAPYRIDRMLTALRASGRLENVVGVCLGDLAADDQTDARRAALDAVLDCLGAVGVPIVAGLPIGHGLVNRPLPLGVPAVLDGARGSLDRVSRRARSGSVLTRVRRCTKRRGRDRRSIAPQRDAWSEARVGENPARTSRSHRLSACSSAA